MGCRCVVCGKDVPPNECAAYRDRHEDCWLGITDEQARKAGGEIREGKRLRNNPSRLQILGAGSGGKRRKTGHLSATEVSERVVY